MEHIAQAQPFSCGASDATNCPLVTGDGALRLLDTPRGPKPDGFSGYVGGSPLR